MVERRALFRLLALAFTLALVSCNGTLTHHGKRSYTETNNLQKGASKLTFGCHSVCNQLNPDGRCGDTLRPEAERCLEVLEQ